ncbi:MAG: IclR family transcriptional regulator [Sphingobium sp.]|uniref:IclR family transcriptional regulator n=2 Tax=Sphingobium sp. TaxID=1912891 RepID=UPI002E20B197
MMRRGTPPISALARSLAMLEAVLADRDGRSLAVLAEQLGVPKATAHRQIATLIQEDYLRRLPGGRLVAGKRLQALAQQADDKQVIVAAAAPVLHRLAARLNCVAQLGTLENDMVTYRIKTGQGAGDFFTKVGLQLEAYCTGIGKVLLAALPEGQREAYLATGPFPRLTDATITDPAVLRSHLQQVREQGFARDDQEIAEGLVCLAVPVGSVNGNAAAAISVSRSIQAKERIGEAEYLAPLRQAAREIESAIL